MTHPLHLKYVSTLKPPNIKTCLFELLLLYQSFYITIVIYQSMKIVSPCGWNYCSIVRTGWDTSRLLLDNSLHWVSFLWKQKQDTEKAVVPRFYPLMHMVKWQKPVFRWLFPVDILTVWTVLQTAGIRMKRRGSTAVPNADRPSLQDLYWAKTPFWLKWWRNWGRQHFKVLLLLVLEMWSATSVL